ncbi:MAG: ATP-binding cassette domain-containing protein [Brevinematales bacterium]|jgi:D-methionine transport system ATP-binding protein
MISIRNLSKTYRTPAGEIQALKDVSLEIRQGEIFGIVGLSGAGKSTLLRCFNRLEEPDSGEIVIGGKNITGLDRKGLEQFRRRIGMIFQNFNLLDSRTVAGNIAYPLEIAGVPKKEIKSRVLRLAELVGLTSKLGAYPGQLSGGQKQRVGIARAVANDPVVLLSDEATSALDPQTTYSILELLKSLNKKLFLTIVLVTHEMDIVRSFCSRMSVMEGGRIVELGEVGSIFKNPQSLTSKRFVGIIRGLQDGSLFYDGGGL